MGLLFLILYCVEDMLKSRKCGSLLLCILSIFLVCSQAFISRHGGLIPCSSNTRYARKNVFLRMSNSSPQSSGNNDGEKSEINNEYIARLKAEAAYLRAEAQQLEAEQQQRYAEALGEAFQAFDTNNDGSISLEELKVGLERILGQNITDEQSQSLMKVFDISGDGKLQFDEFRGVDAFKAKLENLIREEKGAAVKAAMAAREAMQEAKIAQKNAEALAQLVNDRPPNLSDKFFSALVYLLPLFDSLPYGQSFLLSIGGGNAGDAGGLNGGGPVFIDNPVIAGLFILYSLYQKIPFSGIAAFFALSILSSNLQVNRIVRFNTQQSIYLDIALIIPGIIGAIFADGLPLIGITIPRDVQTESSTLVFLLVTATIVYSTISSFAGIIPNKVTFISERVEKRVPTIQQMLEGVEKARKERSKNDDDGKGSS